jgi:RimJ/RimL family protein N-acetyltransferase
MQIDLVQPTAAEVATLLRGAGTFREYEIVDGALPPMVILDQSRYLLSDAPLSYRWSVPFLVVATVENTVIGSIGGKGLLTDDTDVELGYNIAPAFRGRGLATRAIALITELAIADGLLPLAHVEPSNTASLKALLNNGYTLECRVHMPAGFVLDRYRWSPD